MIKRYEVSIHEGEVLFSPSTTGSVYLAADIAPLEAKAAMFDELVKALEPFGRHAKATSLLTALGHIERINLTTAADLLTRARAMDV